MVETVVAAGQRASTSSNLQTYSVVAVTDAGKRERLRALCGNQNHITQAPVFLTWCADLSRLDRICRRYGYEQVTDYVESFLVAAVDAALAMQNVALAAESLGLGMCYIGSIRNNPREVIKLLELPKLVFPISGMTLGWPSVEPRIRPRLATEAIMHWEQYDTSGEKAYLDEYDQAMIATGIYKGRQVPSPDRPEVEKPYGWTDHSARRVSQAVRTELRAVLREQGFGME
jgi:FMN reductase (NADPH)